MHRLLPTLISLSSGAFSIVYISLVGAADSSIFNLFIGFGALWSTSIIAWESTTQASTASFRPGVLYAAIGSAILWALYASTLTIHLHRAYNPWIGHTLINFFALGLCVGIWKELNDR